MLKSLIQTTKRSNTIRKHTVQGTQLTTVRLHIINSFFLFEKLEHTGLEQYFYKDCFCPCVYEVYCACVYVYPLSPLLEFIQYFPIYSFFIILPNFSIFETLSCLMLPSHLGIVVFIIPVANESNKYYCTHKISKFLFDIKPLIMILLYYLFQHVSQVFQGGHIFLSCLQNIQPIIYRIISY